MADLYKGRNILIDFVRGIAIILVVFGHNIQYGSGNVFFETEAFFDSGIFKLIYSFHMPLFAILSGYLFYWSIKKGAKAIVKKRVLSLLVPIISWKTIEMLTIEVTKGVSSDLFTFLKDYIYSIVNGFWFLWAIFFCSCCIVVIEKVLRGRKSAYVLSFVLMLIFPAKFNSNLYIYMYPCFVCKRQTIRLDIN